MCVIFFYVNSNPAPGGYKLILASNRDEFYARETRSAAKWENAEHVYGGIDLEPGREGGTWLAIGGMQGVFKVGALLNLTGEPKPRNAVAPNNILHYCCNNKHAISTSATRTTTTTTTPTKTTKTTTTLPPTPTLQNNNSLLGRGMIVSDFVSTSSAERTIEQYNRELVADSTKYSAFNFISIEIGARTTPAHIALCSNVPPGLQHFEQGKCYGFGNSLPCVPFEKVRHGQQRFEAIVEGFHDKQPQQIEDAPTIGAAKQQLELISQLQDLLKCEEKFWPDAELQRRAPNWGEQLSAINVCMPEAGYGSRTHTIILVDGNDKMHFFENTMAGTEPTGEWLQTHIEKQYFKN